MQVSKDVNLTNCDREPIHIPGSIQPHGALLACDIGLQRVLRHSQNAADFLGLAQHDIVGQPIERLLGEKAVHDLRNALSRTSDPSHPAQLSGLQLDAKTFDVVVHRHKGTAIVEFEESEADSRSVLETTRTLVARVRGLNDIKSLMRQTTRILRGLLEYDRVMVYQFAQDGSGKVIGEAKRADLESFLGQHFPASDIPQQARALYLRNTIRVIGDASGHRIAINPELDTSGEPLDLSYAHLRSVSPIHCEYLRNMGVAASMSISIIIGGELWGLIACHHYSPRHLTMGRRVAAELFGEVFSLHLDVLRQKERLEHAAAARRLLDRFLREFSAHLHFHEFLRASLPDLASLIPSDGIGLWIEGTWTPYGHAPPLAAVPELTRFINQVCDGRVWSTNELSAHLEGAESYRDVAAGVLAIPLTQVPRDYLLIFRREVVQTIDWAGEPNKTYGTGTHGDRLTPRRSFAIWKENVERQSLAWSESDREIAEASRIALLEVILRHSETLAEERRKADVRQKILNEELNHRVKNILALIKSLVSQPLKEGQSLGDYVDALERRIMAHSFAHDQIVRHDGGGALHALVEAELSPYRDNAAALSIRGPRIALDARAFSVLTLVIHEMATNAAKYGALSVANGRLDVSWDVTREGCELRWKERGGPPVAAPARHGFGTVLIDRSIPYDLGGKSDLKYELDGLAAFFLIPAKFVSADENAAAVTEIEQGAPRGPDNALAGLTIMVVEDQLIIAMDVESMLADCGAQDVATYATTAEALRGLERLRPDVAVLDINLGSETSLSIAEELLRRKVPFVFATGYGEGAVIPKTLSEVPIVRKPYATDALVAAITTVLGR